MAKKPLSLKLNTAGTSNDKIEASRFLLDVGVAAKGITMKTTFRLANATGGPVTLNDAQKLALLQNFQVNCSWGVKGAIKPINAMSWEKLREMARELYCAELQGWDDTVDGLKQAMANGATTSLILYQRVPLGYFWRFINPALLAFGRSQMKTLELEVKKTAGVEILANVTFDGDVTIELMPDEVHVDGDPVSPGIFYEEHDDASKTALLTEGMPLQVTERSAVQLSTLLTDVTLKIGALVVHDQVSPEEINTESTDVPNFPADGDTSDTVTRLYELNAQGASLNPAKVPTGAVSVTQNHKDLDVIHLSQFFIPIMPADEIQKLCAFLTQIVNKRKAKLISTNLAWKLGLPVEAAFIAPALLVEETDPRFQLYPGVVAGPGTGVDVAIPVGLLGQVKAKYQHHVAAGEKIAAEALTQELAAGIPGAVGSADGFHRGDVSMLDRVRRELA